MKTSMRFAMAFALVACAGSLSSCNTVAGAGADIERGGEKIQAAARAARVAWHEAVAKAHEEYLAALERCAATAEAQREDCRERARAEYRARRGEARTAYQRDRGTGDDEEAAYAAALDHCDALRDAEERTCINAARARYAR